VDRVEDYVTTRADVEGTLQRFQEMISYVASSYLMLMAWRQRVDVDD